MMKSFDLFDLPGRVFYGVMLRLVENAICHDRRPEIRAAELRGLLQKVIDAQEAASSLGCPQTAAYLATAKQLIKGALDQRPT